jgi:hypothetical protein
MGQGARGQALIQSSYTSLLPFSQHSSSSYLYSILSRPLEYYDPALLKAANEIGRQIYGIVKRDMNWNEKNKRIFANGLFLLLSPSGYAYYKVLIVQLYRTVRNQWSTTLTTSSWGGMACLGILQ